MPLTVRVEVPARDSEVLVSWPRSSSVRAGLAQPARVVLLTEDVPVPGRAVPVSAGGWGRTARLVSQLMRPRIHFEGTFQTNVGTGNNDDIQDRPPVVDTANVTVHPPGNMG